MWHCVLGACEYTVFVAQHLVACLYCISVQCFLCFIYCTVLYMSQCFIYGRIL